jgi:3'-phosphoadenosine 5'-phosphosulfate sulfotransferase (PAPS reductase)/FAD synthetase
MQSLNTSQEVKKPIVASISGGRSSAFMAYLLETQYKDREKYYVFANTGREHQNTLIFLRNLERYILEAKIYLIEAQVNFGVRKSTSFKIVNSYPELSLDGTPFEQVIKKYGLPSVSFPHCTRELKINPIKAFIKEHLKLEKGTYVEAIGFRYDEIGRAKYGNPNYIYPLIDHKVTKQQVNDFWKLGDFKLFDLNLEDFEGNCDFCFKKSWSKLELMAEKYPNKILWWNEMENQYYKENSEIFRGHKVVFDLLNNIDHNDEKDMRCACKSDESSDF